MRLHYLVKLKIVFLCKFLCWKSGTREMLLIDFDSTCTYWKSCNYQAGAATESNHADQGTTYWTRAI